MKRFLIVALICLLSPAAQAQEILKEPICFAVRNEAPYKIYGSFITDLYPRNDGTKARHRSNFRLEEKGAVDEKGAAADKAEFCSFGPFFPGRKLEMTLRTLVPIFTCQTNVESGEIVIHGERLPEPQGGTKTWADCFENPPTRPALSP